MTYTSHIDFAPAYELVTSLHAYTRKKAHKTLDLGPAWAKETETQLTPQLREALTVETIDTLHAGLSLMLLIHQAPGTRTPETFLDWLASLSSGEIYDRIAPYVPSVAPDLAALRDLAVELLTQWNDQYFRYLDPAILTALEADAAAKRALADSLSPIELVERATNGIEQRPVPGLERILLVPQYHWRPNNSSLHYRGLISIHYSVDPRPQHAEQPPENLLRVTRCLADESRLRILRLLFAKPSTFTELVQATGLAKSTVHHHLVALRAAGLLHLTCTGDSVDHYRVREAGLQDLLPVLTSYLKGV